MSFESVTGHELIDALQTVQRTADDASYGDIDEKIAHVRQEVRATQPGF